MSRRPRSPFRRIEKAVGAALVALALSVVVSPIAAADPVGSPTPSASSSDTASPTPTASPNPSVTPDGSESGPHSQVGTTPDTTVSPTPEAFVTSRPAEQQSPSLRVKDIGIAAVTTVSGVLRDATTGAPIRHSCVAWRPSSVTSTATNATSHIDDRGEWSFDTGDPGPFYIAFYVSADGNCSNALLTGPDNYRASWYLAQPFFGTDPNTAAPPERGGRQVAGGSNIVACLAKQNALPTKCTSPDKTASGRVVGFGPVPIFQACIVAIGADDNLLGFAISDADGRWTMGGLPIDYDFIVGVVPPFKTRRGPCDLDRPPPATPSGALQPEFYDDTWVDFSDPNMRDAPFTWATDPNSPHPAVVMRNNQTGIDVCLTTETGRDTERSSCDPVTPTPTPTASASTGSALAATGGPSPLTAELGASLLLAAVGMLARSRSIGRRSRPEHGRRT